MHMKCPGIFRPPPWILPSSPLTVESGQDEKHKGRTDQHRRVDCREDISFGSHRHVPHEEKCPLLSVRHSAILVEHNVVFLPRLPEISSVFLPRLLEINQSRSGRFLFLFVCLFLCVCFSGRGGVGGGG